MKILEILVAISILVILSVVGVWHLSSATKEQQLLKDKLGVISMLSEARSKAISGKDAAKYAVHVEEFKVTMFEGDSYSSSATSNITYSLNSAVHISSHSLQGNGDDVIFSRLHGEVASYGSITLSLINNSLSSTTITVSPGGVVE